MSGLNRLRTNCAQPKTRFLCAQLVPNLAANRAHLTRGVREVRVDLGCFGAELTNRAHPPIPPRGVRGQLGRDTRTNRAHEVSSCAQFVVLAGSVTAPLRWGLVFGGGGARAADGTGRGEAEPVWFGGLAMGTGLFEKTAPWPSRFASARRKPLGPMNRRASAKSRQRAKFRVRARAGEKNRGMADSPPLNRYFLGFFSI